LTKPSRFRASKEIVEIKGLCDLYYSNPLVNLEEIRCTRVYAIYILNVDEASIREMDLSSYSEKVAQ